MTLPQIHEGVEREAVIYNNSYTLFALIIQLIYYILTTCSIGLNNIRSELDDNILKEYELGPIEERLHGNISCRFESS